MSLPAREELLQLARRHGFADVGVSGVALPEDEQHLLPEMVRRAAMRWHGR